MSYLSAGLCESEEGDALCWAALSQPTTCPAHPTAAASPDRALESSLRESEGGQTGSAVI